MWLGSWRQCKDTPLGITWPDKPIRFLGVFLSYDEEQHEMLNFTEKIRKSRQILNLWKTRNLTLFGKVQIVNTFIISQFLYVTSALYIPDCYVNDINNMIIDFIWQGRKPKLKREILYLPKDQGGLGLPDFRRMIHVNYIKWLKMFTESNVSFWKHFLLYFMSVKNNVNLQCLLKSNFSMNCLNLKYKIPQFYYQMLHIWSRYGENMEQKIHTLWYNPKFMINKKVLFYEEFYKLGIVYTTDIFKNMCDHIAFNELITKGLSANMWLKWMGLISCCLKTFKDENLEIPQMKILYESKLFLGDILLEQCSKRILKSYITTKQCGTDSCIPNLELSIGLTNTPNWKMLFSCIYKYLPNTNLRAFQYKLYHNILLNNYKLYVWKIRDNPLCDLCKDSAENIQHVFWECKTNSLFLERLKKFLLKTFNLILTKHLYFTGLDDELAYCILSLVKKYIYNRRCQNKIPVWAQFECYMHYYRKLEFEIAKRNDRVTNHVQKWERLP